MLTLLPRQESGWLWQADQPNEALQDLAGQLTDLSNLWADRYSSPAFGWPGYHLAEQVAKELGLSGITFAPLPDVPADRIY